MKIFTSVRRIILSFFMWTQVFFVSPYVLATEEAPPARKAPVCRCGDHDCAVVRGGEIPGGKGASGNWLKAGFPKRSWFCVGIDDMDTSSEICGMCEREPIRYAHVMEHTGFSNLVRVGCICAAYMEGILDGDGKIDRSTAKNRENHVKSRMGWLSRFLDDSDTAWKESAKGNRYFQIPGKSTIGKVKLMIGPRSYNKFPGSYIKGDEGVWTNVGWFNTPEEAKKNLFDVVFPKLPEARHFRK
jgi:hypothetical protein